MKGYTTSCSSRSLFQNLHSQGRYSPLAAAWNERTTNFLATEKEGLVWRQELALMRDVGSDIRMQLRYALLWEALSASLGTAVLSLKGATILSSGRPALEHSRRSSHDATTWARFQLAQWQASS